MKAKAAQKIAHKFHKNIVTFPFPLSTNIGWDTISKNLTPTLANTNFVRTLLAIYCPQKWMKPSIGKEVQTYTYHLEKKHDESYVYVQWCKMICTHQHQTIPYRTPRIVPNDSSHSINCMIASFYKLYKCLVILKHDNSTSFPMLLLPFGIYVFS